MFEMDKKSGQPKVGKDGKMKDKTSHTLNKVPCIIYDNTDAKNSYTVKADDGSFGLSAIAATTAILLGYEPAKEWDEAIISVK
jgi:2,3-bisphosphoglycerate-independent phosphoglycerate mutase